MSRSVKSTVDRHGKPLPPPRGTSLPTVTLITNRVLETPAEFVIESLPVNPMKKPTKKS